MCGYKIQGLVILLYCLPYDDGGLFYDFIGLTVLHCGRRLCVLTLGFSIEVRQITVQTHDPSFKFPTAAQSHLLRTEVFSSTMVSLGACGTVVVLTDESPSDRSGCIYRTFTPRELAGLELSERGEKLIGHARPEIYVAEAIVPPERCVKATSPSFRLQLGKKK